MKKLNIKPIYGGIDKTTGEYTFTNKFNNEVIIINGTPVLEENPNGGLLYRFNGKDIKPFNTVTYDVQFKSMLKMPEFIEITE